MITRTKEPKPKKCPCGEKFIPRGIQKYHSKACELSYKNGTKKDSLEQFSLKELFLMARGVFQKYIKLRDKGKPCITSGRHFKQGDIINAGHIFKVELFPGLCFNEDNCHAQNQVYNFRMDEDIVRDMTYHNAAQRLGPNKWQDLSMAAQMPVYRNYKYSKPELIEIIQDYNKKIENFKQAK